jgi:hypothetical protein
MNYFEEISNIRTHKGSLHKPLLLLLLISKIAKGHENKFIYDDIEEDLFSLIETYNPAKNLKINPQYPFVYLAGSPILYKCSISKDDLKNPDAASRKEVMGQIGKLNSDLYDVLVNQDTMLSKITDMIFTIYFDQNSTNSLKTRLKL